ncbi:MAG: hypothetical protein AAGJ35_13700, partial [Myxococcota bacterium]
RCLSSVSPVTPPVIQGQAIGEELVLGAEEVDHDGADILSFTRDDYDAASRVLMMVPSGRTHMLRETPSSMELSSFGSELQRSMDAPQAQQSLDAPSLLSQSGTRVPQAGSLLKKVMEKRGMLKDPKKPSR